MCCYIQNLLNFKQSETQPVISRGKKKNFNTNYLTVFLKLQMETNFNTAQTIRFHQTAETERSLYVYLAGFDISFEEFKCLCINL